MSSASRRFKHTALDAKFNILPVVLIRDFETNDRLLDKL